MRIGIIGGSGFVGTELIYLLRGHHTLLNIDKRPSSTFDSISRIADIRDKESLHELLKNQDVVILLAAEHRDDVTPFSLYYDVNVQGMKNVLEAMETNGIKKIIFTSTVALYGLNQEQIPSEKSVAKPFNHYGESKYQAEQILKKWIEADISRQALVLRPTVIFGPNNRGNVYNLLKQIYSGKFLMIGSGDNQKSMAYVKNVVSFIESRIEENFEGLELYNYADKPDFSMNELVNEIYRYKGGKMPVLHIPYIFGMLVGYFFDILSYLLRKKFSISSIRVKKFCATSKINADKVHQSGFIPPFTLREAINKTLKEEFEK